MKLTGLLFLIVPIVTCGQSKNDHILKVEKGVLLISAYNCNYDYHGSSDVFPESCFPDLFFPMKIKTADISEMLMSVDTLRSGLKLGPIDSRAYYKTIAKKIACDSSFCYQFDCLLALPVKITFRLYPTGQDMSICGHTYYDIILKGGHKLHCTNLYHGFDIVNIEPLSLSVGK